MHSEKGHGAKYFDIAYLSLAVLEKTESLFLNCCGYILKNAIFTMYLKLYCALQISFGMLHTEVHKEMQLVSTDTQAV